MRRVVYAALSSLLLATVAWAQADLPSGPLQVRIEGYVGDAPSGVKPDYTWTVDRGGKVYKLQVVKHESLSTTVSTMDIDEAVKPYQPNFRLAGDDKAVQAFTSAKAGERIRLMGDMRVAPSDRMIELDTVETVAAK
jgi:hypothetical protein